MPVARAASDKDSNRAIARPVATLYCSTGTPPRRPPGCRGGGLSDGLLEEGDGDDDDDDDDDDREELYVGFGG